MKSTTITTVEMFKILENKIGQENAEKLITYIDEQTANSMEANKESFLNKEDKIDLINRMDAHFKWLVGIMLTAISIATVLGKLL